MIVGFFSVTTDDGQQAWVRADEVGSFYETHVYPQRKPGRPPVKDERPTSVAVVTLCLRHGTKIHAKGETAASIREMINSAIPGITMVWIGEKAVAA